MSTPESGHRVTLKDIAKAVGITHGAVSLALKGSSRIGEATRKRVQEVAREMGYEPNPMATGLSHFRRNSKEKPIQAALAWLNVWKEPNKLRTFKEFESYWQGASASAEKFGYRLEEIFCKDMSPARLEKILRSRGIDGVLIAPGLLEQEWLEFDWSRFSVVRFGHPHKNEFIHAVSSNQVTNTILAFDHVRQKGYNRIGFVGIHWRDRFFCPGFLWAQQFDLREHTKIPPLLFGADHQQNIADLKAWMKKHKPDAVITEKPELRSMLESLGHRAPEDLGLAATSVMDCPIDAGIDQNPKEIGRVAILVLLSLINDNDRGVPPFRRDTLITGHWVDGASLPARVK